MGEQPSPQHSILRRDPAVGFSPKNCCWAPTRSVRRHSATSRVIEARGERKTIGEWSKVSGIGRTTIIMRLAKGLTPEDAIFLPLMREKKRKNQIKTR